MRKTLKEMKVWIDPDDDALFYAETPSGLKNVWWAGCFQSDNWLPEWDDLLKPDHLNRVIDITSTRPSHRTSDDSQEKVEVPGYGEPFTMDFISFVSV